MREKWHQLLDLFRPAPHRSGFLGVFYFLLILVLLKYLTYYSSSAADSAQLITKGILAAAAIGLSVYGLAALLNRFRGWKTSNRLGHLFELALISGLVTAERAWLSVTQFPSVHLIELTQPYWQTFALNVGVLLVLNAALNGAQLSLTMRLAHAEELATSLRARQQALVFSDEEIREQVAQFLHNRIQSDLMVSSLRLKEIASSLDFKNGSGVLEVVASLEKVRSLDIRGLSQSLGPSLGSQNLLGSLDALVAQYRGQMVVSVDSPDGIFESGLSSRDQLQLGLYRIAEQAVLNSLVHGPAAAVLIKITKSQGTITLEITDDGPGAEPNSTNGLGTSIIDAWVDILGGTKKVETALDQGYSLKIAVPV